MGDDVVHITIVEGGQALCGRHQYDMACSHGALWAVKEAFGAGTGHIAAGVASGRKISADVLNHFGINHPVADTKENKCYITEQCHSLALEKKTAGRTARFVNINDDTEEGQYDEDMRMMSTGFLPKDVNFREFFSLIKGK